MITFKEITKENFSACINIKSGLSDEYMMPVVWQIALNHVYPGKIPLSIYYNDTIIGFVSYEKDYEPEIAYDILVFIIDKPLQKKGYGKKALNAFIGYLKSFNDCRLITLNYNKNNIAAQKLYKSAGFKATGEINNKNNEIVMKLLV